MKPVNDSFEQNQAQPMIVGILNQAQAPLVGILNPTQETLVGTLNSTEQPIVGALNYAIKEQRYTGGTTSTTETIVDNVSNKIYVNVVSGFAHNPIQTQTTQYWLDHADYIPNIGDLIIYSDYSTEVIAGVTRTIPAMKVGDGENSVENLAFISSEAAKKLEHSITIGDYTFDGTADVTVPVYKGEHY